MGYHVGNLPREAPCARHKGGEKIENGEQTVKGTLITPLSLKEEY